MKSVTHSMRPGRAAHLAVTAGLCAAMLLSACGQRRAAKQQAKASTNASLANLSNDDTVPELNIPEDSFEATRRRVAESAALLEEALTQSTSNNPPVINTEGWETVPTGRSGESTARAQERPEPQESTRFSLLDAGGATEIGDAGAASTTQIDPTPVESVEVAAGEITPSPGPDRQPEIDPERRKEQLVAELVGVLTDLARSGSAPGSAALALAGLETLSPDAMKALRDEGLLSDAEAASLDAARKLFDGLQAEGGIADPARVSGVLERIQQDLAARAGLRIARAELCTRVLGYGRYETFPNNRFIAGRAQEVIVYAEVDGFAHNETIGDDGDTRFEIELSQRLELYHVADDLNTWNRAAETDRTVSRNRVRDYYLINQVTLPANLTIGRYHLKVVMRDRIGGHLAEAIIPIEIVAGARAGVDF